MLGWMILFALIAIFAPMLTFVGIQTLAPEIAGLLFALLFLIALVTRLARGRAW